MPRGPKPVFVQARDVPNKENPISGEELYCTLSHTVTSDNIIGIQRIGSLWRIYLNSHEDRVKIITNGLKLRETVIPVYDTNPYTQARNEHLTRVAIKDVPLSVGDELIKQSLEKLKCNIRGDITRQKLRVNGQLINCLNGDRVCFIDPPTQPLPRSITIANLFKARVFHIGQPERQTSCSKCLETGHYTTQCQNAVKCRACKKAGHVSAECPGSDVNTELRNPVAREETRPHRNMQQQQREDKGASDSESRAMSISAITKESNTPIASSSRRQPVISEFLRSVRDAQPCAGESAVTDEETITTDATESEEESSPLSPETPTPKKHGNKPPKRKRKHKKK